MDPFTEVRDSAGAVNASVQPGVSRGVAGRLPVFAARPAAPAAAEEKEQLQTLG